MRADVSFDDHKILFSCLGDKDEFSSFRNTIIVIAQFWLPMLMGFLNLSRHLFIQKPLIPIIYPEIGYTKIKFLLQEYTIYLVRHTQVTRLLQSSRTHVRMDLGPGC